MIARKMDWLALESRIRQTLRAFERGNITANSALLAINDALGEETGRGWETLDSIIVE